MILEQGCMIVDGEDGWVFKINPYSGTITTVGASTDKVKAGSFVENSINGQKWGKYLYTPWTVRRIKL